MSKLVNSDACPRPTISDLAGTSSSFEGDGGAFLRAARSSSLREKGVRSAQTTQAGPCCLLACSYKRLKLAQLRGQGGGVRTLHRFSNGYSNKQ